MRGRLHHKFWAEFAQLDAIQTRADPDGAGPLTSGYDDDFDEIMVFTTPAGQREEARVDQDSVFVPCNVQDTTWEALMQLMAGNSPDTKIVIVTHRKDLERMNLINPLTGETLVRVNDRVLSFRDRCKNVLYQPRFPFYVTQVMPTWGIGEKPDLVLFTCEDREQFARG